MLSITCSGFGGQGVLTAGLLLATVSMEAGKKITWVPSYGSEMRGGTASCHLRISDTEILNPFYVKMNALIAMNEDSVDKFEKHLEKDGILIVNSSMIFDRTYRSDIRVIEVPATEMSQSLKNPRGANIIVLGATIAATNLFPIEAFGNGIDAYFTRKGKNNPLNRECFLQGAKLSEIAHALNEPKTSIYDLLVTAVHMSYIRKNNKYFYIGAQSKKAGSAYTERQEILDIVSPILLDASKEHNVSVSLVFLDKSTLNYVFTVHPDDAVLVARQDSPMDITHASASGKILLTHTFPSNKNKIINTLTYHKFTDRTIANKKELIQELEKVQKQGYAMDNREFNYLLQCIAAPIYKDNIVIASISFSSLNLYVGSPDEKIKAVMATAKHISHLLSK